MSMRAARGGLLALLALAACSREVPAPPPAAAPQPADERIAPLFSPCARVEPFTGDTQDLSELQVTKLVVAEATVAARARADLIAAGEGALPALRRGFDRWYGAEGLAPRLVPLLDLCGTIGGVEARALAVRGLEHPSNTVQGAAVRALGRIGTSAQYEALLAVLSRARGELEQDVVLALYTCDRERLARDAARWVLLGAPEARLVASFAPRYAAGGGEALCDALLAREETGLELRLACVAARAKAGDAKHAQELVRHLRASDVSEREVAARAALAAGLHAEVATALANEKTPLLAGLAIDALAALPDSPARREAIAAYDAHENAAIRQKSLEILCARHDPAAIDRALALLGGGAEEVRDGMAALRAPLAKDEALAKHVLEELDRRVKGGARTGSAVLEKAIAQVPLAEAATGVVERAQAGGGEVQGQRAFRWATLQASNTGEPGRAWMRARWSQEKDALQRLDLIEGGCQEGNRATVRFLTEVIESPRATQDERLYAASLIARLEQASNAAPILKRSVGAFTEPAHLRAFHCLLWRFYGPEPEG